MIRILIVDDWKESRYFLSALLKSSGYEVEDACDGAEALDKARQNPPQLIISDLLMPVMDGYTLLREWRADDRLKQIPFIVYTATYTDSKDEQLAFSLGANAFILKLVEPEKLIARIRQALAHPAARGMAASPSPMPAVPGRIPVAASKEEDARNLRQYSEVLVHKLEDKMEELDKANRELQRDITEHRKLEEQFRQSQKMEAFGQLAGGVAHDFNNILAVIQLQIGLLKSESDLSSGQLIYAGEIEQAVQRAANLTRQLLLFSRKQTMQPKNLKLKDVVHNMTKMLERTLGEQVQLQYKFAEEPLIIHADPSMIDQILLNLAVNARDAMPKGGQITIETAAAEFDEVTATQLVQARPGSFACLSVSDTGCGIPPEILPRIFEPFFTTKEAGKGTGLGLATVLGIVEQHQGWINVYSEVGRGTTFRVYLPRQTKATGTEFFWSSQASPQGGSETILLVEDDSAVRNAVRKALLQKGYRVLEAANGDEALAVWKQHHDEIRLLLTDLVMPGETTGKELAGQLLQQNPKIKVIYASGYSVEVAGKDYLLEEGVNFLAKPFQAHTLAQTVRHRLDGN